MNISYHSAQNKWGEKISCVHILHGDFVTHLLLQFLTSWLVRWVMAILQCAAQWTINHQSLNQKKLKRKSQTQWTQRLASLTVWTTCKTESNCSCHCNLSSSGVIPNLSSLLRLCEALAVSDCGHHTRWRQEMVEPPQDLLHHCGAWLVWNLHNLYDPAQQWSSGECCHQCNKFRNVDCFMMALRYFRYTVRTCI